MSGFLPLLALFSLSEPALAVLPGEHEARRFGSLPAAGLSHQRVMRYSPGKQARLHQAPAWQQFLQAEGQGWQARFDERTGLPYRAWGRGIPLQSVASEAEVEASVRAILQRHPELFGGDPAQLALGRIGHVARTDTWYLRLDQLHQGRPVYRASVEARVRFGKLIMLGVKTYPRIPDLGTAEVPEQLARLAAIHEGPAPDADHRPGSAELVVLPVRTANGLDFSLAWELRSETWAPRARWVSWVDAHSGELLAMENELPTLEGVVYGEHDTRTVDGDISISPMPYGRVRNEDDDATYTDADGLFELQGEEFSSTLAGDHVRIYNLDGDDGALSFSGEEGTWDTASASQSEIDSYIFVHHVRDWAIQFAPEVSIINQNIKSYVDDTSFQCNAYYDGSLNFAAASGSCNAIARIADVNYHEWGHGFHYYSLQSGYFDSSTSEAIADTMSFLQTGDSVIAPYFYKGYSVGIRDVDDFDHVYPDDWVGEVHYDGMILGGAIWDLLQLMQEVYGEEEGWTATSQLYADAVPAGFSIPESFDEFVAADDDDGDLSNGTPHYCELLEAFTLHGLGPSGSDSLLDLSHAPLENQEEAAGGYLVEVLLSEVTRECFDLDMSEGVAWYSTDFGESWSSVQLELDAKGMSAWLPEQPDGTVVHYYIEGTTEEGDVASVPVGGVINPFSFAVGELNELYFEDFESGEGGFSHALLDGEDQEGADDWMHGAPAGLGGDPDHVYSGEYLWGNDLGGGNYNGEYQNDKWNQLQSDSIAVAPYNELLLQFRRWLNVEDGYYDQSNVLADGEVVWSNHATEYAIGDEHHEDDQWSLASIAFDDADLSGSVQLAWQIHSDGGLTMGGWNIDDVAIYAPPTPRNLMVIFDFQAAEEGPGLLLSWTNPDYQDLQEIRVLHRTDAFPQDHEDGTQVLGVASPEPGAAFSQLISDAPSGQGYYAVFASDSEGTWTRGAYQGYNADLGEPGEWFELAQVEAGEGCGCASGRGARGAMPLALLALLGLARRRR